MLRIRVTRPISATITEGTHVRHIPAEEAAPTCNSTWFVAGGRDERTCSEPADPQNVCAECGKARCAEHAHEEAFENIGGRILCEDCQPTQPEGGTQI